MPKTVGALETEIRMLKLGYLGNNITRIILQLIKYGFSGWVAYNICVYAYLIVNSLSGQETVTDIKAWVVFKASTGIPANVWFLVIGLLFAVALAGIRYGRNQRALRKNEVERLGGRIRSLEARLDNNRSSSNLTPRGETNPEDIL